MRILAVLIVAALILEASPARANNQTGLQRGGQVAYTAHPYTTGKPTYNAAPAQYGSSNGQYTSHPYAYSGSSPQSVGQTSAMNAAVTRSLRTSAAY